MNPLEKLNQEIMLLEKKAALLDEARWLLERCKHFHMFHSDDVTEYEQDTYCEIRNLLDKIDDLKS